MSDTFLTCTSRKFEKGTKTLAVSITIAGFIFPLFTIILLTVEQITHAFVDFLFPALSAVASTITFLLQRLILNTDYMEKCQRQIDEVVGNGRLASLDDRIK